MGRSISILVLFITGLFICLIATFPFLGVAVLPVLAVLLPLGLIMLRPRR